ncbi:MAG: insulinase family protein [Myxococcota bacterium]
MRAAVRRTGLACLALLTGCPSGPSPLPSDAPPGNDRVEVHIATPHPEDPPLTTGGGSLRPALEHHTLANGLDVSLVPDHGSPLAIVQLWAKVGSVDEHEAGPHEDHGITGLSHFFEHLMFQGTARFPNYDDALTPLGAQNNAFTYQDSTAFWAYAPKQHLRLLLDIEADRFQHIKVDFTHLEPEREVVKNERRQRTDSDPAELAEERATKNAFDHSTYKWGPIGWMTDLDSITLEEAQAYHTAHYHPGGATMIIAGDFDPAEVMRWVDELWGPIPANPNATPPTTTATAETWVGPRTDHVTVESPTATVSWAIRVPAPKGATLRDYAALELIDYILTAGKAGRLQKELVYAEQPKLSSLGASLMPLRNPYVYTWRADLLPGVSVGSVEAALFAAFRAIAKDGVTPDELQRAVASLRTDLVHRHLSNSDRAEAIGFSLASTGEPFSLFDRLEAYATITPAELEACAARWLVPEGTSRVVVVAPSRYVALAKAWEAAGPTGAAGAGTPPGPLDGSVSAAAQWFADSQDLAVKVADADREERAIALLAQRGDVAKAKADAKERSAIDKYLSQNEMGTTKRRTRLKALRKELAATAFALSTRQKALAQQVAAVVRRSEVSALGPKLAAVKLLLDPPENLAVPLPPATVTPGSDGAHALALQVLASWVLEARGLAKTAQDARAFVLREAPKWTGPDVPEVVKLAMGLAHDTSIEGLPLVDVPLHTLRPTPRSTP